MKLTKKQRIKYFEMFGLGEYNEKNIKKLQTKYFPARFVDGKYGNQTDILLRNLYRTKVYSPHFDLKEFKCECRGKYCTTYPKLLNIQLLLILEELRVRLGVPITITSGLRDKAYNNSLAGSIPTSYHLYGEAVDICCSDTTTLAKRKEIMKWIAKQKGFHFTYCNGWQIGIGYSGSRSATNMGTSIHFEVKHGYKASKADKQKALDRFNECRKSDKAQKVIDKAIANADKWAKDNKFHYVNYESGDKKTQQCPVCHPELQKVKKYCGWNCIGFVSACYHHAGVKTVDCRAGGIVNDGFAEYTNITEEKFRKRNGNCWKLIYKKKEHCPTSKLKKGDVCICYQAGTSTFKHIVLYAGDGYIYDSTSGQTQTGKRKYSSMGRKCYVVFRYTGE